MTEKLYDRDAYLAAFSARVLSCTPHKKEYAVVLDRTAFFPEGGGQAGDSGRIGEAAVRTTVCEGGEILHLCDRPLAEGAEVSCTLDFDLRFDRMQQHTGEHILSGLIHRHFGLNNVGFHLGEEETTFDFDGVLDRAQLDLMEDLANGAVLRNMPITCYYPTPDELPTLSYRAKLDLTENVRIVHIEDYDDCACCAPHVRSTGEVGLIRMPDFIHYKGGVRIRLLCGRRALADYRRKDGALLRIAQRLSVPTEEAEAAVLRLAESELGAKAESAALAKALADARAESIPLGAEDNFCFFEDLLGDASMRRLALAGAERTSGLVAVLHGSDREGYRFCMAGKCGSLRSIGVEMTEQLLARCGGSNELISGKIPATKKEILTFFAIDEE